MKRKGLEINLKCFPHSRQEISMVSLWGVCVLTCFCHVWLFATPWTVAHQAPLSMGFSRQECWSGLPCPPPGDLPHQGIEPPSPALQVDSLWLSHQGSSHLWSVQFSRSVVSDSLWPHGLQHTRPPCPSPAPGACSNSIVWFCSNSMDSMSIESVMPSNHLILCHPLLLMVSVLPSIRVFSNESVLHITWLKYWSFSFGISPSNEYSGLTSFRIDWFDLVAVQGTLKSLLQQHSSKASILQHSAFFMVQLSHPYITIGKTIALTKRTFVGKVMSLLFNICLGWS